MKRIAILVLIAALGPALSIAQQPEPQPLTTTEREVRSLERAWLDAYEKHDPVAMDRIVAEDFIITFPEGGLQTKPQLMASIRAPRKPGAPSLRFYTEEVQSRAYGDTVILIGRVVTEYERDGKMTKEHSRYTDTYVRRDGRWQVVASHLSNAGGGQ
ncbi:MAG: nuclear transport factor 2 family protein [Acidobacteria bacterium]|nr:nuclear transport factor 2 family protein [Acidobacteriota bacterium]